MMRVEQLNNETEKHEEKEKDKKEEYTPSQVDMFL